MTVDPASIGSLYERAIVDTGREDAFLFFAAFLLTFGFIRTSAHLIRAQVSWWPGNVEVGGTHIHHLVWGILLLLISGYLGFALQPGSPWREAFAVLFGVGAGLTLDEFALWLNLKDVYWSQEGRRSIDAVIIAAIFAGLVLVGFTAWIRVAKDAEEAVFAAAGFAGFSGIALALVNLAKEKFGMALLSLLFSPAGLIPALRLARPNSVWAKLFYGEARRGRARERFEDRPDPLRRLLRRKRGEPSEPRPESAQSAGSG